MRRVIGVLVAVGLLCGVGYVVFLNSNGGADPKRVQVLIGSEKAEFFDDPAVAAEFKANGLDVRPQTIGSWSMASADLKDVDLAFPSSRGPAEEIAKSKGITAEPVRPFYSPLVVIAHKAVADVLQSNGLAEHAETNPWKLRMGPYLDAVKNNRKWSDLKNTAGHADLSGEIYLTTTDPRTSSSGALHLAAVSYLANGERVVADDAAVAGVAPLLKKLTDKQGDQKTSSDGPFSDFKSGVGNPLVLVYESQVASLKAHGIPMGDLVVLYPDTTVWSDHTAVGLTPEGRKMAELLRDSPKLRALEAQHGFRPTADQAAFAKALEGREGPTFAADLTVAQIKQAQVAAVPMLARLVEAAKGK
ncbi:MULTISPECIES: hypothetical protein [unclassified Kitasatospora]|uniref:hypothetical protein n=1 Tax=unclassified Kitasatospora TaxID=2633591 RepID=UPI0007C686FA|nr:MULTISPECIES: hypothetical protein [unclassified Kitasatospora]